MTGCGCLLLIAALVGLLVFLIFGSTDPGQPIESAVAGLADLAVGLGERAGNAALEEIVVGYLRSEREEVPQ